MSCDTRPTGEVCNCCGDAELRELITSLTTRISELETRIRTQELRDFTPPVYNDCSGFTIATNAQLATCDDLRNAINSIQLPDLSGYVTRSELDGILQRISNLETEIKNLNALVVNLTNIASTPGRDNNFGGRVDQAVIDQINQQITNIINRFPAIEQAIDALEECCEEFRSGTSGAGQECVFDGWSIVFRKRPGRYNNNIDEHAVYHGTVIGPQNKTFTLDFNSTTTSYQITANTGPTGQYNFRFERDESSPTTIYLTTAQVIHCGRKVADSAANSL